MEPTLSQNFDIVNSRNLSQFFTTMLLLIDLATKFKHKNGKIYTCTYAAL